MNSPEISNALNRKDTVPKGWLGQRCHRSKPGASPRESSRIPDIPRQRTPSTLTHVFEGFITKSKKGMRNVDKVCTGNHRVGNVPMTRSKPMVFML